MSSTTTNPNTGDGARKRKASSAAEDHGGEGAPSVVSPEKALAPPSRRFRHAAVAHLFAQEHHRADDSEDEDEGADEDEDDDTHVVHVAAAGGGQAINVHQDGVIVKAICTMNKGANAGGDLEEAVDIMKKVNLSPVNETYGYDLVHFLENKSKIVRKSGEIVAYWCQSRFFVVSWDWCHVTWRDWVSRWCQGASLVSLCKIGVMSLCKIDVMSLCKIGVMRMVSS